MRKGDKVIIISGKDKGFKGEIIQVDIKNQRVIVDGANLIKKHMKSGKKNEKGQRIEMPAPIHVSNAMLYCEKCGKGVKASFKAKKDGEAAGKRIKIRVCKKCKNEI